MFVLGTAGHVDHGKSSFLRCLTLMEPDRLPEEKKRGMTIDLGFVHFRRASGERVGIVDVPGHQRFVKNMISGAMNVDGFLFLVAADDGWMPQSEEHLQVLRNLGIRDGIGILTKIDLVDGARAKEVQASVETKLAEGFGKAIDVIPFAAPTAFNLPFVRERLEALLDRLPAPREVDAARLWVDRVFLPKGLGVVVTGTLREGRLREGDEVLVLPLGKPALVKSLQSYHEPMKEVGPVARVALQLARIEASEVTRGVLLQKNRRVPLTRRVDARARFFVPVSERNLELAFHVGTRREAALVVRLGAAPDGQSQFLRLKFPTALPLRAGDRFVLRTPGEERTLAAGEILDPLPGGLSHKQCLESLALYDRSARGLVALQMRKRSYVEVPALVAESSYTAAELEAVLADRIAFRHIGPGLYVENAIWEKGGESAKRLCLEHHRATREPLGETELLKALAAELKLQLRPLPGLLTALVVSGQLRKETKGYWHAGYQRVVDPAELLRRKKVHELLARVAGQPLSLREIELGLPAAKKCVYTLVQEGALVSLADEHFLEADSYREWKRRVLTYLEEKGQATTSELRTHLGTSRKNAVLVLEQMDRERLTFLKEGVRRILR